MATRVTGSTAEFAAALPRRRQARRARCRDQDRSASRSAMRAGTSPDPPRRSQRTKFTKDLEAPARLRRPRAYRRTGRSGCRSTWTEATARAPSRSAPSPATSPPLGLPILLWDERWSTQAVERAMIDADVSRARRAEKVDALAAAHILQGAIDALVNQPPAAIGPGLVDLLTIDSLSDGRLGRAARGRAAPVRSANRKRARPAPPTGEILFNLFYENSTRTVDELRDRGDTPWRDRADATGRGELGARRARRSRIPRARSTRCGPTCSSSAIRENGAPARGRRRSWTRR